MEGTKKRFLILAKTYPTPQKKLSDIETVCTGAVGDDGKLYRLFPIPFRLLEAEQRFSKFEWIEAYVNKSVKDARPESFVPVKGTIERTGVKVEKWVDRIGWLQNHLVSTIGSVDKDKQTIIITKMFDVKLSWVPNDHKEKHESNIAMHENLLFPLEETEVKALRTLHVPENVLQVKWIDIDGNSHMHKLFEWEYYKTLADFIHRGLELEEAEEEVLENALRLRFKSDDREIWGLFGTTMREMSWILGSVFNPPIRDIQAAKQDSLF